MSPARAPLERSRPGTGIFTEIEVMLTIRPKPRSAMPSITRPIISTGGRHVHHHALEEGLAVDLAEVAVRRAAVVVDEDVGRGTGLDQRGLHCGAR